MPFLATAKFPDARIRGSMSQVGLLAQCLKLPKQVEITRSIESGIEEGVGHTEDGCAVDVVLDLLIREIADAHGPHCAVTGEASRGRFAQFGFSVQRIDRLQRAALGVGNDALDVAQVALEGAGRPEPVQRIDDEVRVAQPAIAVVPVALRAVRFRQRSRERGDDSAGVVERVEFESDRCTYDLLLPLQGDREVSDPASPIALRFFI